MSSENVNQNQIEFNVYELKICPKCGKPISYIEEQRKKSNVYYVAVHYLGYEKPIVKKCYLGPKDYKYVTKQHNFTLHGMIVLEREIEYLKQIINDLKSSQERIERKLDEIIKILNEKLK